MEILYLIIPFSLIFLVLAIKLLFWAINSGQYDDLDTEAQRILFEEDVKNSSKLQEASRKLPDKSDTKVD